VRTLADDIGCQLGCGAALQELRRTASGPFCIAGAVTLADLEAAAGEGRAAEFCLSPMTVLAHLPEIQLTAEGVEGLRFGRAPSWDATLLDCPLDCTTETLSRLTSDGALVAVATLVPRVGAVAAIVLKRVLI
jgi:tRNA pseudouridine55 synthase